MEARRGTSLGDSRRRRLRGRRRAQTRSAFTRWDNVVRWAYAGSRLWTWFTAVDTDSSGHISAKELQQALVNGDWTRACQRE